MKKRNKAILATTILLVGCTAAQWFQLVNALLPLATDIAVQFATYSGRGTLSAADAANIQKYSGDVKVLFADIGADVAAWQSTKDPSKLAHIDALLAQIKTQSTELIAILQVKDTNTLAFITAIVQDSIDLAGLIPIIVHPPVAGAMEVRMRVSVPKAKSLEDVFKSRLANLPK